MEIDKRVLALLDLLPRPLMDGVYGRLKRIGWVRRQIDSQYDPIMEELEGSVRPYSEEFPAYRCLPAKGHERGAIIDEIKALAAREESTWRDGYVSGAVYHGEEDHVDFLNQVYALNSQVNPLHSDLWPRGSKFEAEIVAMTAGMLGASEAKGGEICGTVTSGGTESILLAMKAYRDWARDERGVSKPNLVVPSTAHAAFDKACDYFGIIKRSIPVGPDFKAHVRAMARAIDGNTIALVGSAPAFPHGLVDPIEELSEMARKRGLGFHTDACLGGFILPWAAQLGYPVPPFDFRLPGVTSLSADTHKFGYAAKGTSVVLYRSTKLRRHQYFTLPDWPGGLYFSPTLAGSRPGALSAACWAAMLSLGEEGYREAAGRILAAAARIKEGIGLLPELKILGDPLFVISFTSEVLDIYRVLDAMRERGWNLNGLHRPPAIHLCVTLRHTKEGVAERFLEHLGQAVEEVRESPPSRGGMAPVYGLAARMPVRGLIRDMLERYMDLLYRV